MSSTMLKILFMLGAILGERRSARRLSKPEKWGTGHQGQDALLAIVNTQVLNVQYSMFEQVPDGSDGCTNDAI